MIVSPAQPSPELRGPIAIARDGRLRGQRPAPSATGIPVVELDRIARDNDRLLGILDDLASRIHEARRYLDTPTSNTRLAMAHLGQLKARKSHALGRLRANAIAAAEWILALPGAPNCPSN